MSDTPATPSDPRWDAALWNAAQMAEACAKLGGVVLAPAPHRPTGFTSAAPKPPRP